MQLLDKLPWLILVVISLTFGLAPFGSEPHVIEKLKMLMAGSLSAPIDMLDLFLHGTPWLLLGLKSARTLQLKVQQ